VPVLGRRGAVGDRASGVPAREEEEDGAEQGCAEHGEEGRAAEQDHREAQQALRVCLTVVRLLLAGPYQQRDDHAGEDAAEEQFVHHVRQGVGQGVRVGHGHRADRGAQDGGPQQPAHPARQAAHRHRGTVAGDRRPGD
jgi:hypothetical protein